MRRRRPPPSRRSRIAAAPVRRRLAAAVAPTQCCPPCSPQRRAPWRRPHKRWASPIAHRSSAGNRSRRATVPNRPRRPRTPATAPARSVRAMRPAPPDVFGARRSAASGTAAHSSNAMPSERTASSHHHPCQPLRAMKAGRAAVPRRFRRACTRPTVRASRSVGRAPPGAGSGRRRKRRQQEPHALEPPQRQQCFGGRHHAPALASERMTSPSTMVRRGPSESAAAPMARPSVMPATCTSDRRKPACTRPMCSASRSTGRAGGSLPMCRAALMPASTTITARFGPPHAAAVSRRRPVSRSCSRRA